MKLYKKWTAEKYSSLVNNTTLPWDNNLRFSKYLLKLIYNKIMAFHDQIIIEKLINTNTLKVKKYFLPIKTK